MDRMIRFQLVENILLFLGDALTCRVSPLLIAVHRTVAYNINVAALRHFLFRLLYIFYKFKIAFTKNLCYNKNTKSFIYIFGGLYDFKKNNCSSYSSSAMHTLL